MITFKGKNNIITTADRITRAANYIYPHTTENKVKSIVEKQITRCNPERYDNYKKFLNLTYKNTMKINSLREQALPGIGLIKNIIFMLQEQKIGNCYESARIAEIIAKINGQQNIYPMRLFVNRNSSGVDMPLDHVVSVITNKNIAKDMKYAFKNKDAIILDPWLGITEFAGNYLTKIKNEFCNQFIMMPNNELNMRFLRQEVNTLKEFNEKKKSKLFNPKIKFKLHDDEMLSDKDTNDLRILHPELILNNYKNINI